MFLEIVSNDLIPLGEGGLWLIRMLIRSGLMEKFFLFPFPFYQSSLHGKFIQSCSTCRSILAAFVLMQVKWRNDEVCACVGGKSEREGKPFETNGGRDILFAPE